MQHYPKRHGAPGAPPPQAPRHVLGQHASVACGPRCRNHQVQALADITEQQLRCFKYGNLQPVQARDSLSKAASLTRRPLTRLSCAYMGCRFL